MSVLSSPKSIVTRGRLIDIEGGSALQPAINLKATARGILAVENETVNLMVHAINEERQMKFLMRAAQLNAPKLEMRHVG